MIPFSGNASPIDKFLLWGLYLFLADVNLAVHRQKKIITGIT